MKEKQTCVKLSGGALELAKRIHSTTNAATNQLQAMCDEHRQRSSALQKNAHGEIDALVGSLLLQAGYKPADTNRIERLDLSYLDDHGDAYLVLNPVGAASPSGDSAEQALD